MWCIPVLALALTFSSETAVSQVPTVDDLDLRLGGAIDAIAIQPDGKILFGGWVCGIRRIHADGALDTTFSSRAQGNYSSITSLSLQSDGKVVLAGEFTEFGGLPRNNICRLNADGSLDTAYNPRSLGIIHTLASQADGKILVGGNFYMLGGQLRTNIGRLNASGTLDTGFKPSPSSTVYTIAVQPDGRILIGGVFKSIGGQKCYGIGRLSSDGTLDTGFSSLGANMEVYSLAVQPDGKILVGGYFTSLGGQPRNCFGRLNPDGTLDAAFTTEPNANVLSISLQTDGKIVVGGAFTMMGGQPRNGIARLNADGTVDASFYPEAEPGVRSLAIQPDGKILAGGSFNTLGGKVRRPIGRLYNTEPATQSLTYSGSRITWLRVGTSPEVWRTTFEYSTNGVHWVELGPGTRIPGGWQSANGFRPTGGSIRARGYMVGGCSGASSWFVESSLNTEAFPLPPMLSVDSVEGSRVRFKLTGDANSTYEIQTTTNLPAGEWQLVTTGIMTNEWERFDWTNRGEATRFFRAK